MKLSKVDDNVNKMLSCFPSDIVQEILLNYTHDEIITICSQTSSDEIRAICLDKEFWRRHANKYHGVIEENDFFVLCCTENLIGYIPFLLPCVDLNYLKYRALKSAIKFGNVTLTKYLLPLHSEQIQRNIFENALSAENFKYLNVLVKSGFNTDYITNIALRDMYSSKKYNIVRLFLTCPGIDEQVRYKCGLALAVYENNPDRINELLSLDFDPSSDIIDHTKNNDVLVILLYDQRIREKLEPSKLQQLENKISAKLYPGLLKIFSPITELVKSEIRIYPSAQFAEGHYLNYKDTFLYGKHYSNTFSSSSHSEEDEYIEDAESSDVNTEEIISDEQEEKVIYGVEIYADIVESDADNYEIGPWIRLAYSIFDKRIKFYYCDCNEYWSSIPGYFNGITRQTDIHTEVENGGMYFSQGHVTISYNHRTVSFLYIRDVVVLSLLAHILRDGVEYRIEEEL